MSRQSPDAAIAATKDESADYADSRGSPGRRGDRQIIAHSVSYGTVSRSGPSPGRGERAYWLPTSYAPAGAGMCFAPFFPRLAPWALFFRPFRGCVPEILRKKPRFYEQVSPRTPGKRYRQREWQGTSQGSSLVTCHLSLVTCHLSLVTRHLSLVTAFQRP